jgi:AAA ATPase domain
MSTKFLTAEFVRASIRILSNFHPFFGITFLVMKRCQAPIGSTTGLVLDAENHAHLIRYFRLDPRSNFFFTPFKIKRDEGRWRDPRYASTTLQAVNTQSFAGALLHEKNQPEWGWVPEYLSFLQTKLPRGQRIPLFALAAWHMREEEWRQSDEERDLLDRFLALFPIAEPELNALFTLEKPAELSVPMFSTAPASWRKVAAGHGIASDVPIEQGATLRYLSFHRLGPATSVVAPLAERLNLLTGDNGLGKTFFLDIAWWALTREWIDQPIVPDDAIATPPTIRFTVSGDADETPLSATYDMKARAWRAPSARSLSGLVIYARVDGSFAVWDPLVALHGAYANGAPARHARVFNRDEVWTGDASNQIEGLLRDWVRWQLRGDEEGPYETFVRVVERTRPPDAGRFDIGTPVRLAGYSMEVPTLVHPYGSVPVTRESAGIKRVLALAYLIVWAWEEHKILAKQLGRKQEQQLVILLDEAEAHLHPRWQRVLMPALLGIADDLHGGLAIQYVIATHSPMVLASTEQVWNPDTDSLFNLRMTSNGKVMFDEIQYVLKGTADAWLRSDSFGELYPGSVASEEAVRKAKRLIAEKSADKERITKVTEELGNTLAPTDPFWLRWIVYASANGVAP